VALMGPFILPRCQARPGAIELSSITLACDRGGVVKLMVYVLVTLDRTYSGHVPLTYCTQTDGTRNTALQEEACSEYTAFTPLLWRLRFVSLLPGTIGVALS
jgi:hypothetical protein